MGSISKCGDAMVRTMLFEVGPRHADPYHQVVVAQGLRHEDRSPSGDEDDVENLSQILAVAPALAKLALRDVQRGQFNKEPPWKRIAEGPISAM